MLNELETAAPLALSIGLTYLVHSTIIALCALIVCRMVRRLSVKEYLWKWALLVPFLTTSVQWQFSSGVQVKLPGRPLSANSLATTSLESPSAFSPIERQNGSPAGVAANSSTEIIPVVDATNQPSKRFIKNTVPQIPTVSKTAQPTRKRSGVFTLVTAAISIAVLLLGRSIVLSLRLFIWSRRKTFPANKRLRESVHAFARSHGIVRKVRIGTAAVPEPCSHGLLRWSIVFPISCESGLTDTELEALVAHEFAHLVRRDPVWLWVFRLISNITWFQPCNRMIGRRLREISELRCDEWAVETGITPLALARCLTAIAERLQQTHSHPLVATAVGTRSRLAQRIERLVMARPLIERSSRIRSASGGMMLLAATVFLAFYLPRAAADTPPRPETSDFVSLTDERPTEKVTSEEPGNPLTDSRTNQPDNSLLKRFRTIARDIQRVDRLLEKDSDHELRRFANRLRSKLQHIENEISRRPAILQPTGDN